MFAFASILTSYHSTHKKKHLQKNFEGLTNQKEQELSHIASEKALALRRKLELLEAERTQLQEKQVALDQQRQASEEATVADLRERAAALASLRTEVAALAGAFSRRSEEQRASHLAHQLQSVAAQLNPHLPCRSSDLRLAADSLVGLAQASGGADDGLLTLAAGVLADVAAEDGVVPTHAHLASTLPELRASAGAVWLLDEAAEGGAISRAAARMFAALRMRERAGVTSSRGNGCEATFARVEAAVAEGNLLGAVIALEASTSHAGIAARETVAPWCLQARRRASVDEGARLLSAYAATVAASFV